MEKIQRRLKIWCVWSAIIGFIGAAMPIVAVIAANVDDIHGLAIACLMVLPYLAVMVYGATYMVHTILMGDFRDVLQTKDYKLRKRNIGLFNIMLFVMSGISLLAVPILYWFLNGLDDIIFLVMLSYIVSFIFYLAFAIYMLGISEQILQDKTMVYFADNKNTYTSKERMQDIANKLESAGYHVEITGNLLQVSEADE